MPSRFFFDKQDRELLRMINETIDHGSTDESEYRVFDANLHPHGILELTTTHEFRMAHAVVNLLGNLEAGKAEDRLFALRTLHDEVLHSARSSFRYNTGRVLIQIMKEIVRARADECRQLKLVRDFRRAATGNPRLVRLFLERNMLLEMPEEWNQLTMDHHVHDANTKGRKNPTHLIMDAWIKGIRYLTVVYYNYVDSAAARELLEAAEIMGLSVRIGLEFRAPFRGRFISFVWAPRGFSDPEAFLAFLAEQPVVELMREGRKVSQWVQRHVLNTLNAWNTRHRPVLAEELEIDLPELSEKDFLIFVGAGRPSFLHLAECIHQSIMNITQARVPELLREAAEASPERAARIDLLIRRMDSLTPEVIQETWIRPERNPDLPSPRLPNMSPEVPELLRLPPQVLMDWLATLRSGYRIILQLPDLTPEDVMELLWDCQGMITHFELFNLKEWQDGRLTHLKEINALQIAINEGSALHLKHMLRTMIRRMESSTAKEDRERCDKFRVILRNIPKMQAPYKITPLRARIGTDSTSHSSIRHGMGLAIPETLPPGGRRAVRKGKRFRPNILPVKLSLAQRETFLEPPRATAFMKQIGPRLRKIWGFRKFGLQKIKEWRAISATIQIVDKGNVITMGGLNGVLNNGLRAANVGSGRRSARNPGLRYLNTRLSNVLKVLIGFIPAMLVFACTQDWWLLAWLGAPIWFFITGMRNIAQAVLGGGGIRRSSLLHWTNFIDWTRISDSLMYTGLSVVLLEWIIRDLLLEKACDLTTSNSPLLVFSIIAMANSLYIIGHNIFRGFPKEAVVGNIFRSVLAIPISLLYNQFLLAFLMFFGLPSPLLLLEQSAAITSKGASDTVAGLIEGFADARNNHRLRFWDYKTKLNRFFDCYAKLELKFPDRDMLSLLSRPKEFIRVTSHEARQLQIESIIHALDLMYFWMYQPYARQTLNFILRAMTREERVILARAQLVLMRVREVSQLFVDGYFGPKFAKALSFYLDSHEAYINDINRACAAAGHRRLKGRQSATPDPREADCENGADACDETPDSTDMQSQDAAQLEIEARR